MSLRYLLVLLAAAALAACADPSTIEPTDSPGADSDGGVDAGPVLDAGGTPDTDASAFDQGPDAEDGGADAVGEDTISDGPLADAVSDAGDASPLCTPGVAQCAADGQGLELCAASGAYWDHVDCANGCEAGACVGYRPLAPVEVTGNVLHEPETGWTGLGFGISAFYCPSVPLAEYEAFIDAIADAGMDYARFSGSTLSWGNREGRPEVIPFLPGVPPYEPDNPDVAGYTNEPDPAFFDELDYRLDYATSRGIRVQYTMLWGATKPMFVRGGDNPGLRRDDTRDFLQYVAGRLAAHPEHLLEIINEADHGHHLAVLGREGRREAIADMAGWIHEVYPGAVLSVSDGGRQPDAEGDPYFDYHMVDGLDYWNVHYPRDDVAAQGIPRWARGVWHLYTDRDEFRAYHAGLGYGRNDENIFLQTQAEHDAWAYGGSTRDWQMVANMMWVSTMAGVGFTLHSQKGFFCYPNVTEDPIFGPIRAFGAITDGFPFGGARTYNTAWAGSPIREFDESFKAFALVSGDGRDMLMYVLNPAGTLRLDIPVAGLTGTFYDPLSGTVLGTFEPPQGSSVVSLPAPLYEHGMAIRIRAGATERPTVAARPAGAVAVDGELADWDGADFVRLQPPEDYQSLGGPTVTGGDLHADFAVAWDADALLVAVDVTDEAHVNDRAGDLVWDGDSVQLAFDVGLNGGAGYDDTDDFELGYALTAGGVEEHRWYAPTAASPSTATFAVTRGEGATRYEVRIPWSDLQVESPAAGLELGFSLMVNDADAPGPADVGAARDGWIEWTPGIGRAKTPGAFGRIRLE